MEQSSRDEIPLQQIQRLCHLRENDEAMRMALGALAMKQFRHDVVQGNQFAGIEDEPPERWKAPVEARWREEWREMMVKGKRNGGKRGNRSNDICG